MKDSYSGELTSIECDAVELEGKKGQNCKSLSNFTILDRDNGER